jgi:hypothetical protein
MVLSVNRQVATVVADNTLCCIQYHIYDAIHMQIYATFLRLISISNFHAHSDVVNEMPMWFFIHLSMNEIC